jgi:hypothetical protein
MSWFETVEHGRALVHADAEREREREIDAHTHTHSGACVASFGSRDLRSLLRDQICGSFVVSVSAFHAEDPG